MFIITTQPDGVCCPAIIEANKNATIVTRKRNNSLFSIFFCNFAVQN